MVFLSLSEGILEIISSNYKFTIFSIVSLLENFIYDEILYYILTLLGFIILILCVGEKNMYPLRY